MRNLTLTDAFTLSRIIDKMDIQMDINKIADEAKENGSDAQSYLGGQLIMLLMKSAHKAENELTEWIASLSEEDVEVVKKWKIKRIKDFFNDLAKVEDIGDFFKQAVSE